MRLLDGSFTTFTFISNCCPPLAVQLNDRKYLDTEKVLSLLQLQLDKLKPQGPGPAANSTPNQEIEDCFYSYIYTKCFADVYVSFSSSSRIL